MKPVFFRFSSLGSGKHPRDLHIHTDLTDGTSSLEEYCEQAVRIGLTEIAFTEHVRRSSSWYISFVARVEQLRELYKNSLTVYHGIETKILNYDGELDATEEMLDTAEIILGSVHRFPDSCYPDPADKKNISPEQYAEIEFRLSCAILERSAAHVLAHPGGMYIRKFDRPFPAPYLKALMEFANRNNKAIEINSSYWKNITLDRNLFSTIDPYVSLGSDAHNVAELGTVSRFLRDQEI